MIIFHWILLDYIGLWSQEGDDVYFDCEIQANPRVHEIVWKHNVRKISKISTHISRYIYVQIGMDRNDKEIPNISSIIFDHLCAGRNPGSKQRWADHERGKFDHPTSFQRLCR